MEKTIVLNKLKSNEYSLWITQTEIEVYKCLDIVLGNEPNPTTMDDNDTLIGPIGEYFQAMIIPWKTRHALAREDLLRSLEPADILKVTSHRDSAQLPASLTLRFIRKYVTEAERKASIVLRDAQQDPQNPMTD